MTSIAASRVFNIKSELEFEKLAIAIFQYQSTENAIYSEFVDTLAIRRDEVGSVKEIPFLPVELFKTQRIQCGKAEPEITFSSSGTTGFIQSSHHVTDISIYVESFRKGFNHFYGEPSEYTILALLPSYLEREGSSLIYMVDDLLKGSDGESGYFLYNHFDLYSLLKDLKARRKKTLLIGVTYALLDFVEAYSLDFPDLLVMETGGMKGKRKEMIREELHATLCAGFGVSHIHSEYGMTELLSQAYSKGEGKFECPPWMRVLVRDPNDPFTFLNHGITGGLNIIDLANLNSCSFIATQDLGKIELIGKFEILGRFDNSDIRGCNLLVQ